MLPDETTNTQKCWKELIFVFEILDGFCELLGIHVFHPEHALHVGWRRLGRIGYGHCVKRALLMLKMIAKLSNLLPGNPCLVDVIINAIYLFE